MKQKGKSLCDGEDQLLFANNFPAPHWDAFSTPAAGEDLNNGFILKLLAPALLIALAFVLAAAGRPQGTRTDGVVDYFNVGSHAPSETFRSRRFASFAQRLRTQTEQVLAVI